MGSSSCADGPRFGVFVTTPTHETSDFDEVKNMAVEAEKLDYDSVWVSDHFYSFPTPGGDVWESLTTLSALAPVTTRIRLGVMALCNSYRSPSLLAKISSTIDLISKGRLDLGIGMGWYRNEYDAYGFQFPSAKIRAAQLSESARILRLMWTQDKADYYGQYYSVREAINSPKPIQKPHPLLWIAGQGQRLTLPVAACLREKRDRDGHCRHTK